MKFKNNISKFFLFLIPILLFFGYGIRISQNNNPIKNINQVYAADVPILFEYAKKKPDFENVYIKPTTIYEEIALIEVPNSKVKGVKGYLESINAPLAKKSLFMVQCAKYYKIDHRLLAAISVIESTGGKFTYRPHNAWGWGGSGNAYSFSSWEEGILNVSRGLAKYYSFGAKTPRQISKSYNPVTPNEWARKVSSVMYQMR